MADRKDEGKESSKGRRLKVLKMSKETLADLTDEEASAVQGGNTKPPNCQEQVRVAGDDPIFLACR